MMKKITIAAYKIHKRLTSTRTGSKCRRLCCLLSERPVYKTCFHYSASDVASSLDFILSTSFVHSCSCLLFIFGDHFVYRISRLDFLYFMLPRMRIKYYITIIMCILLQPHEHILFIFFVSRWYSFVPCFYSRFSVLVRSGCFVCIELPANFVAFRRNR